MEMKRRITIKGTEFWDFIHMLRLARNQYGEGSTGDNMKIIPEVYQKYPDEKDGPYEFEGFMNLINIFDLEIYVTTSDNNKAGIINIEIEYLITEETGNMVYMAAKLARHKLKSEETVSLLRQQYGDKGLLRIGEFTENMLMLLVNPKEKQ